MQKNLLKAFTDHAAEAYPNEACGLVVRDGRSRRYIRCTNAAKDRSEQFSIPPKEYAAAEDIGEVLGVFHSHPDATSRPSPADLAMCCATALPWWILSWPEGDFREVLPEPLTPLLGRPFVHGAWDCWQICADWYKREWGVEFEAFKREDGWWERADGPSLYEQAYEAAGFVRVSEPQRGDMIVMAVGRTVHPNHAGIYLDANPSLPGEEAKVHGAGPFLLHHLYGRPSDIIIYGGPWQARTRLVLRHKNSKQ